MNKITNLMVSNRLKKKRLSMLSALAMALFMALFTQVAQAQTPTVFMKDGNYTIQRNTGTINFYDSHGPSQQTNYWETWYAHNENFTYVFKPAVNGDKIKVTFQPFAAYAEPADPNSAVGDAIGNWTLRLNDDVLKIYQGNGAVEANMIAELTGNSQLGFSVMSDGPMTFQFSSNGQYREEGWYATVELVTDGMAPQAPFIQRATCSDMVEIFPTTHNAKIIYSIGANDPQPGDPLAPPTYEYTGPIDFPEGEIPSTGFKVNAMSQLADGGSWSTASHITFQESDRVPIPDADDNLAHTTITRVAGTNTIVMTPAGRPSGLNDTYQVRYTMSTNGTEPADPTYNNSTVYTGPITATVNGTIFKAKTFAVSCTNQFSEQTYRLVVDGIYAPAPVIDFDAMTITATEGTSTFDILYTTDGSTPSVNPVTGTYSAGTVTLSGLTPGQTVRAIAYRANNDAGHTANTNYTASQVVSAIYVPEGGSGTYGGVVLLDDREDHTWAYYSNESSPIKSLNPADVKITYEGNGKMYTSTTATPSGSLTDASGVKVSASENEDTFIYLKTLERANGDAGTGNLAYTLIPNPFSVRPKFTLQGTTYYTGFYGWRVKRLSGMTISGYSEGSIIPAETEVQFVSDNSEGNEVEFEAVWARAYVTNSTSTSDLNANVGYERNFMVLGSNPGMQSQTVTLGSGTSTTSGRYVPLYINRANGYGYSLSQQIYTASEIGSSGSITSLAFRVNNAQSSNRTLHIYLTSTTNTDFDYDSDWGAYASVPMSASGLVFSGTVNFNQTGWKTITLDTPFEYDGSSNIIVTVFDATGTYMNTSPRFYTYSGNAVYNSRNSGAYTETGYYYAMNHITSKPQIQFTIASSPLSGLNVPLTVTTYNPDGTGGSSTVALSNGINCAADLKIENIRLNSMSQLTANGHNLVIGRGVTGEVGHIRGMSSGSSSAVNYTIRLESGTFGQFDLIDSDGYTFSNTVSTRAVFGCDYDRAKNDNSKLSIAPSGTVYGGNGLHSFTSANNRNNITYDWLIKSGKVQGVQGVEDANAEHSIYMGNSINANDSNSVLYCGKRRLTMEGGEIASIAGGVNCYGDNYANYGVNDGSWSVLIRIKGGTANGSIYGAAAFAGASGDRRFVLTNGTVKGWIAGGANGVQEDGGVMYGNSYVYVGGKTQVNSSGSTTVINRAVGGNVFGAGCGYNSTSSSGQVTEGTNVVIADEAYVERGVYGGGSYGYTEATANVHVLGGTIGCVAGGVDGESYVATIKGGVFGGACQNKGGVTNVTIQDGMVNGNVYGGSNSSGTINGLATIIMSGGTVTNVFGGGCGSSTIMSNNTKVTVTGGTINANMYGGGENGDVNGNSLVSFEDGSVTDIYGAGKGSDSNVALGTTVNVKGGVVNGAVYGGGENGTVAFTNGNGTTNYQSIVSISGGEVKGDVFGGGKLGTTQGKTTVNISGTWDGTILRENVFAGAYGQHGSIYVAGLKTLNISGGRIYGSVYGGSRNANDGNTLNATGGTDATSITNISGGRIDQHVYAAGYYGDTKGSVYAFIGLSAINNAPNSPYSVNANTNFPYDKGSILIGGTVWAGGDWGVFTGTFGAPTISGNSNIYINGEGYSTEGNDQSASNYMNIQGSIFGSGSSCDAGEGERTLILSHYGADITNSGSDSDINPFSHASRQVNSIQRFHNVIFDDAHLGFVGQGKINSLNTTEKYALYEIDQNVYLANGSTMVMNVPSSQLYSFHSVTIDDAYTDAASAYHVVPYNGLGATGSATDNKIRVNGGSYVEIKYVPESTGGGNTPGGEGETLEYHFDSDLEGWTAVNADNDNYTWGYLASDGHDANGCARVRWSSSGHTPEDWLISPQVTLGGSFSFWTKKGSDSWTDSYEVYVSTSGNSVSNFTKIADSYSPGTTYEQKEYDLSSYSGQGYVAIKYVGPANQYYLYVDDITITQPASGSGGDDPQQPTYTDAYGELSGFAHMMAGNPNSDATCAYARPKQSQEQGNILPSSASDYFHNDGGNWTSLAADGGFVSYRGEDNDYTIAGVLVNEGNSDQLRYENHYPNMRNNSEYYRIWRHGGDHHTVEAVVTANAEGNEGEFKTVEVEVQLPSWGMAGSYYRFDRTNNAGANNTLIDYGPDVMTYNGANYSNPLGESTWMYFDGTTQQTGATASNTTVDAALQGIKDNPNLNFGLVLVPGQTMLSGSNYIINSDADTYLASVEKPFMCEDNLHIPTLKLILTYSDELSANATLEPVHIYLVQCGPDGTITDYVDIVLTINTSTQITSGFKTQIYARMDGSLNTREMSTTTVVLPTFNVAESGEMAQFYLQKVEFKQDDGVVIESSHGTSVVCAETVESTGSYAIPLNIDRFAMTIAAQANPDNTDDWRDATGPQDAVQPSGTYNYNHLTWGQDNNRGVHLGDGKGRNPLALGFTLYYNSNENAPAKSKMGDMVFTIEVRNIEGGTGTYNSKTFTVTVEVYRIGPGANFYVDGINGQDLNDENRAKFPDKAAKTVNFILNRLGYMPGDNIIVVNELPINKLTTWDGSAFQNNVKMYRYPGGHLLTTTDGIIGNADNNPYLGPLVDVTNTLNMKGVIMDGMYAEATAPVNNVHNSTLYPTEGTGLGNCTFDGIASAPLIIISNGARVNLTNTTLQNNYNNSSEAVKLGGAVHVSYEGILAMNVNNRITANYNAKGGGVYVDGSLIVSDYAYIWDNYKEAVSGGKADPQQNNVELENVTEGTFRVVQIGTSDSNDAYDELVQTDDEGETKIGVSKDDWNHAYDGYMPVVYAESGSLSYLNNPFNTQSMVVHDGNIYKLERYTSTDYSDSPNYLYWLGTWVTAVTEQPAGFNKDQIDTPEELAWAISIVNGENGCTPAPNTSFTLTGDIDMKDNIWVPIGNETALYNGTFEGNGHVVEGLRGSITRTDMGMFGRTNTNAKIQNMVVYTEFNTNSDNLGTVVGNMTGGTLSNVEGAGENTSRNNAGTNGGLVGINGGTIHSSFAVTTITGGHDMGGLVAINNGDLINAYSASEISGGTNMAGLVAANNGRVENCYNATNADVAFAVSNKGSIKYCYTAEAAEGGTITYVTDASDDATLEGHGTYGAVKGLKEYGYMYDDNKVTASGNDYVKTEHEYLDDNHTVLWDGLLSVLNQWVADNTGYTTWNRPTTQDINGDLPILAFPMDNCVGNFANEDGKFLRYSAADEVVDDEQDHNGLDALLTYYSGKAANIYLYQSAVGVANGSGNANLFIHEDAALLQNSTEDIKATVGITFDNSCKKAVDVDGTTLKYDWHLMSTPLANAPLGLEWSSGTVNWWDDQDWTDSIGQVTNVSGSYLPDGDANIGNWDFYCYFEEEYHWINFKRNSSSHFHYDEPHDPIAYTNESNLIPGKGYMAAIKQDSYLNNYGTLTKGDFEIEITAKAPDNDENGFFTYDKGSNLIGNPYQAYLDLGQVARLTGYDNFFIYAAESGNYAPWHYEASENPTIPSQFIHPHQAFFVVKDDDSETEQFPFTYQMATAQKNNGSYFRGSAQPRYPLVNLFVENERGNRDLAVIEFNRPELDGVRKIDNLRNANFKIAAHLDGQNYGLVFVPEGTERVPVHFRTTEESTFTLTWQTLHGEFTSLILVDNLTGVRCDMLRHDHYTFNGSIDDYAARFYITYNVTDVNELNGNDEAFAYFDGNDWIVTGKGQLQVVDVTGRVLKTAFVNGDQTRLHLDGVAAGVYVMRLTDGKKSVSQKIVVK